jgi:hypothetical protein
MWKSSVFGNYEAWCFLERLPQDVAFTEEVQSSTSELDIWNSTARIIIFDKWVRNRLDLELTPAADRPDR